jgi:hypothetical protein
MVGLGSQWGFEEWDECMYRVTGNCYDGENQGQWDFKYEL